MILAALVTVAAAGAGASGWGLGRSGRDARLGLWAGVTALLLVVLLDFAMTPPLPGADGTPVAPAGDPFGGHLVATGYLRLVIGLEALMAALLVFSAWLVGGLRLLRGLLPATLGAIAGTAVALGSADLGIAVVAAIAVGLAGLPVVLADGGPLAIAPATRELRVALVSGAILLAVVEVVPVVAGLVLRDSGPGTGAAAGGEAGAVIGLLALAGTGALAVRYGAVPFHVRIPRLADVVHPMALPLLFAWVPLPLAVVGIAVVDNLVAPLALPLDGERAIIIGLAAATLAGAALAAFVQDDLRHATGYLVIADAGILVLAAAALDPAAWGPTRAWVVVLAASKTALGAWAALTEERFGTRSIPDLRGWMRRSPLLAAGFVVATLATFGLPGWVAFEARTSIAELVADGGAVSLLVLLGWLTLPTYVRLAVLGTGRVTSKVDAAAPERFLRPVRSLKRSTREEQLPVETETTGAGAAGTATSETAAGPAGPVEVVRPGATRTKAARKGAPRAAATGGAAPEAAGPIVSQPEPEPAPTPDAVSVAPSGPAPAAASLVLSAARSGLAGAWTRRGRHADRPPLHQRLAAALHRDRTELLAGSVLALALLAALTSWGALGIGAAAAEPAPEMVTLTAD